MRTENALTRATAEGAIGVASQRARAPSKLVGVPQVGGPVPPLEIGVEGVVDEQALRRDGGARRGRGGAPAQPGARGAEAFVISRSSPSLISHARTSLAIRSR